MASKIDKNLIQVENEIEFLKNTDEYTTRKVRNSLKFLYDKIKFEKMPSVAEEATKVGLGEIFVKMSTSLEPSFTSHDTSQGEENLKWMEKVFWNYTNKCPKLGCNLSRLGAIDYMLKTLEKLAEQPEKEKNKERLIRLLGILHNSIRQDPCGMDYSVYRKAGAVDILKKYANSENMILKFRALLVLGYIVNDQESEILGRECEAIVFLMDLLKRGVNTSGHSVRAGGAVFAVEALLKALKCLTINDANKVVVLENGGIPVINRILTADFTTEEQQLAAEVLWNLTFVENIRGHENVEESMKALKSLSKSTDKSLGTISRRVLEDLENKEKTGDDFHRESSESQDASKAEYRKETTEGVPEDSQEEQRTKVSDRGGHVMISYNWTHQQRALEISNQLKKEGYEVWIDVEKMSGDILECMANAVNHAEVVLLCMSRKYYESTNCRSEATYTYKKKKPKIPLVVEADYRPDGWLDMLIGCDLYYHFETEEEVQKNMPVLIREIRALGRKLGQMDVADLEKPKKHTETTTDVKDQQQKTPSSRSATSWSSKRVQEWFKEIGLPQLCSSLEFCDGRALEEMFKKHCRDSAGFEEECKSHLHLEFFDLLKLTTGLRKEFEVQ